VNKSFLKFLTDFGPLAIFFFFYYNNDKNLSVAIPPLIVATLIALGVVWFFEKKNTNYAFSKWNFDYIFWGANYLL
jgi:intracellular septation protein